MIFNIVGILIGALIAGGAGFYLVKGEKDAESKKINTIGLIAGLAILAFAVVRTVFFSLSVPQLRISEFPSAYTVYEVILVAFPNLQSLLRQSSSSRQFLLSLPVAVQLRLHERNKFIHTQEQLRQHAAFLLHTL